MNRREFLGDVLAVPLAGLALAAACGGDDGGAVIDARPPNCLQNGTIAAISSNHGHSMIVTIADITAAADKTYELVGADHTHTAIVTAAGFGRLAANQPVMITSSVALGHSHDINIRCA